MRILPIQMLFILLLLSCNSSKQGIQEEVSAATQLPVNYEINCNWANPIGNSTLNAIGVQGALGTEVAGSRINIAGNTNYLRTKGDSIFVYLPYYGTRTTGATPIMNDLNSSIQFEGIPENYVVSKHATKNRTQIMFDIHDDNGRHHFLMKLYTDKQVTIDVNATHRSRIQYEGTIVMLE